ncbi:hypothetical protein GCM10009530_40970 [Microbispora corallina]|uniref:Peptidase C51 domain-containing protein n=1 Tax=Microbispora corallina TaxID=83302 RepID=A0ABQ4GA11_9ACTN|nr:CHAP domain-containing protein [Microbispora corallina]GIH43885.1 hypothetical protein Mco01_68850 [Microbispora corallina]
MTTSRPLILAGAAHLRRTGWLAALTVLLSLLVIPHGEPARADAPWVTGHARHAGNDYPYPTGNPNTTAQDPWHEYYGQCDSFGAWKVYENLSNSTAPPDAAAADISPVDQFHFWATGAYVGDGKALNADAWKQQAQSMGYVVDDIPTPGAIAWWPNGADDPKDGLAAADWAHGAIPNSPTGHVGYVTDVYPDGSITVEQYNMRENARYSVVHMAWHQGYSDDSYGLARYDFPWPGGFVHIADGPEPGAAMPPEPNPGVVSYEGHPADPLPPTVAYPGDGRSDVDLAGADYPGTDHGWYTDAGHGYVGQMLWTNTHPGAEDSTVSWHPRLTAYTCYQVDAYVPDQWSNSHAALYTVYDQHFGSSLVPVDENDTTNGWVELGVFQARDDGLLPVKLTDQGPAGAQVAADAMRYVPRGDCSGAVRASETIDFANGGAFLHGDPYPGTIDGWYASAGNGQQGNQYYTYTNGMTPSGSATWNASVIPNACYKLFAFVPGNHANSYQAMYTVSAAAGAPTVSLNLTAYTNNLAGLGTYRATAAGNIGVILTDQSPASGDAYVTADTISFVHTPCPATVLGPVYPSLTVGPGSPLAQFTLAKDWYNSFGHGDLGYEKWTNGNGTTAQSKATWTFSGLPVNKTYSVCAYIPDDHATNTQAHYQGFRGTSGSATFTSLINQDLVNGWQFLGTLNTGSSTSLRIVLDDTGGGYTAADAMRLTTGSC